MNIESTLERIYSMHQFHIKLGLERIEKLLAYLGNPERDFQSIHIAGSNGKGSTASFISSILIEAGYKTGLYTSPHLQKFNERIRINSSTVPDEFIIEFIKELDHFIRKEEPSFFEITTALAFKYFSEMKIDVGVIETGLGGRLDATNTLSPLCSVITTISDEHSNILGKEINKITAEKAGIIKRDGNTFVGLLNDEASNVIRETCSQLNSNLFELRDFTRRMKKSVSLEIDDEQFNIYKTPLAGYHQFINATLAILTVRITFSKIDNTTIFAGIDRVITNSGLRCRFEYISEKPKIILDAAHNVESVQAFAESFDEVSGKCEKKSLIFGAMKDKDVKQMLGIIAHYFDQIYLTTSHYERAMPVIQLKKIAEDLGLNTHVHHNPVDIISEFLEKKSDDCLVVLGSIYLLGEILNGLETKIS
ncbi:MAG: bifunctional folylpolyglutamate synthase/dihydrofolate synthase [Melioribacteraceae bacterium]|nr:bifunctional folylpolyglutamate synthase/dihydrofolate synthase [Melioribacteraceae bacterium]MCO6472412.1 bifunctional folylpolyglutamate synthase/dihydrofolate synthase [Melioribacteraceae bacterium]